MTRISTNVLLIASLLLPGCSRFDVSGDPNAGVGADGGGPSIDAQLPIDAIDTDASLFSAEDIFHVPASAEYFGTADLSLNQPGIVIDTSQLTITGISVPDGVLFDSADHDPAGGPELALLHVRNLDLSGGVTVRVQGRRPLVVLARDTATIAGVLDGSANGPQAGPGGHDSGIGPAAGQAGEHESTFRDGGGGGGGFGSEGARGGTASCPNMCAVAEGGVGGAPTGTADLALLEGGSGGGDGGGDQPCGIASGGAGGGIIQISAGRSIRLSDPGGINVGGGGGAGGLACDGENWGAGGGGGAGGAILLQAPELTLAGRLAANGGGGGGGAGDDGGVCNGDVGTDGESGSDGLLSMGEAAGGAAGGAELGGCGGNWGAAGGDGAALTDPAADGGDDTTNAGNGGGGGGGVGRIAVRVHDLASLTLGGISSPDLDIGVYTP